MRKSHFAVVVLTAIGTTMLVACNKPHASLHKTEPVENTMGIEKTVYLSDTEIIAAIQGNNPTCTTLDELDELLIANARLSNRVVHALIAEKRVPNFIVETALVLSTPISDDEMTYLSIKRPGLSNASIKAAAASSLEDNFTVLNTKPRQVIFGRDMVKSSNPDCDCGDGTITVGSHNLQVILTSETTPLDPSEIFGCNSNKWICGTAKVTSSTTSEGLATYNVTCTPSNEKCMRQIQPQRDH